MINFASDNYAPVHPRVFERMQSANQGPAKSYGNDEYTEQALGEFKKQFGPHSESFMVWNGTAANVLGLGAAVRTYQSVICADVAHIANDECGAPEKYLGAKLILIPTRDGKLTVDALGTVLERQGDVQATQAKVVSLTQSTEYGTVYNTQEIKELVNFAHSHELFVHVDGARIANAAVSLNLSLKAMITDLGVDILSFGGTKNGLMGAEAVVFPDQALAKEFKFIRKQGMHLASKMRYLSAQFLAYFENDLWKANATHANQMASVLAESLTHAGPQVSINQAVQANGVFATLSPELIARLQKKFHFYLWNRELSEVRLMCSFNTSRDEIRAFTQEIAHSQT